MFNNYNAVLLKKAEDRVKKEEKELALAEDMAKHLKEQLTALMVEEMSLKTYLRTLTENPSNDTTNKSTTMFCMSKDSSAAMRQDASTSYSSSDKVVSSSFDTSLNSETAETINYEKLDLEVLTTLDAVNLLATDNQSEMEFELDEDDTCN